MMVQNSSRFGSDYLTQKRQQLLKLRAELRSELNAAETDEALINNDSSQQAREYEDDGQRLDTLEREGHLVSPALRRLTQVDRALEKIAEGTYGLSDLSGQPISVERLEVLPDAICTSSEEEAGERR
jgi:DnaK suppressor protein